MMLIGKYKSGWSLNADWFMSKHVTWQLLPLLGFCWNDGGFHRLSFGWLCGYVWLDVLIRRGK